MVVVDNRKSSYHACEAVGVAAAARKIASSRAYSHLNAEARWERRNRRHQPPSHQSVIVPLAHTRSTLVFNDAPSA